MTWHKPLILIFNACCSREFFLMWVQWAYLISLFSTSLFYCGFFFFWVCVCLTAIFCVQDHIFKLMKSDSYSRYLRSDQYKEYLSGTRKKVRHLPGIYSDWAIFKHWLAFTRALVNFLTAPPPRLFSLSLSVPNPPPVSTFALLSSLTSSVADFILSNVRAGLVSWGLAFICYCCFCCIMGGGRGVGQLFKSCFRHLKKNVCPPFTSLLES